MSADFAAAAAGAASASAAGTAGDKYQRAQQLLGRQADAIHTSGLRSRLNLAVFWDGARAGEGRPHFAMQENGKRVLNPLLDFAEPAIAEFAAILLENLRDFGGETLHKLFEVRFYLTSEQLICVLLYHRDISDFAAAALRDFLQPHCARRLDLVVLARKQRLATCESFLHRSRFGEYEFNELCFIQPSLAMNEKMLAFAHSCAQQIYAQTPTPSENPLFSQKLPTPRQSPFFINGDLLELYCGYGNFSLALAPLFRRVFATEIAKNNAHFLARNKERNRAHNLFTARLSDAECAAYLRAERPFRRCEQLPNDWQFAAALIDPPRSGAESSLALLANIPAIIYISCNPESLARDFGVLKATHEIARFELFDQFINSEHLECGVLLLKRRKNDSTFANL